MNAHAEVVPRCSSASAAWVVVWRGLWPGRAGSSRRSSQISAEAGASGRQVQLHRVRFKGECLAVRLEYWAREAHHRTW